MKALPRVTLAARDGPNIDRLVEVVNYCASLFQFGAVKVWSDRRPNVKLNGEFIPCKSSTLLDYNKWEVSGIEINTDFCLIVQCDGFIINPQAWKDEWLNYDYIGAPWPRSWIGSQENQVGNGGFSLRSKKFIEASKNVSRHYRLGVNSDVFLCRHMFQEFIRQGIKFAPVHVATDFSWEGLWEGAQDRAFGFHHGGHLPKFKDRIPSSPKSAMKLNIVTPCSRPGWLLPAFRSIEEATRRANIDCQWTLIVNQEERKQFPELWMGGWVKLWETRLPQQDAMAEKKMNDYFSKEKVDGETWLWIMSDDNLLPVKMLAVVADHVARLPQYDVVVVSHKRGQRRDRHECHDLIANGDNMRLSHCSGEQVFFKRKLYIPWGESAHGDGRFIEYLHDHHADKIMYLPTLWTVFDAQKATRWDYAQCNDVVFGRGGTDL